MSVISVYQRNWAFTHKDAEKPIIRTGSFGPCCVVTFTSERFAAMTHVDAVTDVNSIGVIFNQFSANSVELKDVKVIILGGWIDNEISFSWRARVITKILEAGFRNVSTKNMFSKKPLTKLQIQEGIPESDAIPHYHLGAQVDARTGATFILKKPQDQLDIEQKRQTRQLCAQYINKEISFPIPINQVL